MTERTGYSLTQIILHWLTAIGVITAFLTHDAMKEAFQAVREQANPKAQGRHKKKNPKSAKPKKKR